MRIFLPPTRDEKVFSSIPNISGRDGRVVGVVPGGKKDASSR